MKPRTSNTRIMSHNYCLAAVFLIAFVVIVAVFHPTGDPECTLQVLDSRKQQNFASSNEESNPGTLLEDQNRTTYKEEGIARRHDSVSSCNLFAGKWIFDNVSQPLYEEGRCSFMRDEYACQKYGRKDVKYQKWRWQPHDCDLPRFNGTAFMEKIRGKKLIYVGDSFSRNQWTSLLCLIESTLHPSSPKAVIVKDNLFLFQSTEYNVTIGFYWSPFLVESNLDDPYIHRSKDRIIRIMGIEKHARHWTDADILIFGSFIWWQETPVTLLWGSFDSSDAIYKTVEVKMQIYEMALNTWSQWLEININRTKTKLFFMSPSPRHFYGERWDVQQHCVNETEPIFKEEYWGVAIDRQMMQIAESTIEKLERKGIRVEYLNITRLSDYRKDAHPSIYRDFFRTLSEEEVSNPKSYADCGHWCLPGVPDVWNQILYSYIINS